MKVLSVASEIYPLIKTGGLADVAGALPLALQGLGIETRTLVPGYPAVMKAVADKAVKLHDFPNLLGEPATLLAAKHAGLDLLILDAPAYFGRMGNPYNAPHGEGYSDNWRRFAALSKAGAEIAGGTLSDWRPDIVHTHDWQAAMTTVFMRYAETPEVPSILTIHNIAFQGNFDAGIFPWLGLPSHALAVDGIEYYGRIGYLKGGLQTAWAVSTVSPTYAREIETPQFGMGLEGLISARAHTVHGIVNGIDTDVWDPETDETIARRFTASKLRLRDDNRIRLCENFGLDNDDSPIFSVVSRLTWQKGMDLLAEAVDALVAMGGKLAVLGSGDYNLEQAFLDAVRRHPGRVGTVIGYDETLSHMQQAGADAILIPSRFEPCGLTQLYALRYGCVPVVARTGGLADTVVDANPAALASKSATGIQFSPVETWSLIHAIRRTIDLYNDKKIWLQMQKQGMKSDVSWDASAARYADLYSKLQLMAK
ncbi:glycogen synthase GlgA [Martelella endophytica]|uniref:Glycogen synthase n=1 Tax=Martelella endophytica TaxID=1486262 RepID=A0A0D5LKW3_MAREN|nr:glycogen synthase GlgA [Martelella endophytica]AJY44595.1 glycogen synthase [Martelella endophytica]